MISFVAMNEDLGFPTGEMMIDGELLQIDVLFDNGSHMSIFKAVRGASAYGAIASIPYLEIALDLEPEICYTEKNLWSV